MPEEFAVIGLAVMGENLVLNLSDHGVSTAVFNRTAERTKKFIEGRGAGRNIHATYSLAELVGRLQRPRKILLMVQAGKPVDDQIQGLVPLLDKGDILIDGGNSLFRDTERRFEDVTAKGLHYIGTGVSGGEEGARYGPSIMPGGTRQAYEALEPILTKIAAKTDSGPCVTYVGDRSGGHFVKMVHNGIEYGDMQLICEAYDILRRGAGLTPKELADVFAEWNRGELQSFLIEITAKIVAFPDDQGTGDALIDHIDDRAGQKGTGKWTTQAALDLGLPIPTITAAVDARLISSLKEQRLKAAEIYRSATAPNAATADARGRKELIDVVRKALYAAKICSYAQGFAMLAAASQEYKYGLHLGEVARIWKGGCIIRAIFLDRIRTAFQRDPQLPNLLLDSDFSRDINERQDALRRTVGLALGWGIPTPAFSASLAYFESYRSPRLPANLLQGQRDYFGAHTYQRTDRPGTFHTEWTHTG
jgi:6-phosphogluconate dehydrogenase